MNNKHSILVLPLCLALLATAFCVWSALGNDVSFCVTTGCSLYQDFSIGGISLWWFGTAAFAVLAGLALLGAKRSGRALSALCLFGDLGLLLLMALTAPCVSCLVAAIFFALLYLRFRCEAGISPWRSLLFWVWLGFFIVNLGAVARSSAEPWAIAGDPLEARTRMFFSPSCRYCVQGINVLSGNVETAFFPLCENDADFWRVAKMAEFLNQGMNLADALGQSQSAQSPGGLAALAPDMLILRFRLLRNKAHVLSSGSQGVPFFEQRGLPSELRKRIESRERQSGIPLTKGGNQAGRQESISFERQGNEVLESRNGGPATPLPHDLPPALTEPLSQCGGQVPCPPGR